MIVMTFDWVWWQFKRRNLAESIVTFVEKMHREIHINKLTGMHMGNLTLTRHDRTRRRIYRKLCTAYPD